MKFLQKLLNKCLGRNPNTNAEQIKTLQSRVAKLEQQNKTLEESQNSNNFIITGLENRNKNLVDMLSAYKINKQSADCLIETLEKKVRQLESTLKEQSRKNRQLIRQKLKLKDEIKELKLHNSYYIITSELQAQRVEYLCFGSVLPKVMRTIDYQFYLNPTTHIKKKWVQDKQGISVYAEIG